MVIKTFGDLKKIQNHIKNKRFGLKDYDKTAKKYYNYKQDKVYNFFKDNQEAIKEFLDNLEDNINISLYKYPLIERHKEFETLNKRQVNMFKTFINGITYHELIKGVKWFLEDSNSNEEKVFAIKLYIHYYETINKIMEQVLREFYDDNHEVLSIDNKQDLKKYLIINKLQ